MQQPKAYLSREQLKKCSYLKAQLKKIQPKAQLLKMQLSKARVKRKRVKDIYERRYNKIARLTRP